MHESCGIWIMPDLSTNRVCNKIKRFVWDHLIVNEKLSLQGTKSRALLGAGGYTHSNLWLIIDPCGVPHEKITVTAACFDRRRSHRNFPCLNVHVEQPASRGDHPVLLAMEPLSVGCAATLNFCAATSTLLFCKSSYCSHLSASQLRSVLQAFCNQWAQILQQDQKRHHWRGFRGQKKQ